MAESLLVLTLLLAVLGVATGLLGARDEVARSDGPRVTRHGRSGSGVGAGLVAASTVAGLTATDGGPASGAYALAAALAAVVAFQGHPLRVAMLGVIGVWASLVSLFDVLAGTCGQQLPSVLAGLFAVAPAAVVALGAGLRLLLLPNAGLSGLGHSAVAAAAVLRLGVFAVHPGGLPLMDGGPGPIGIFLPVLLWLLLLVVAVGCGLHPRAGADAVALGLILVNVTLGVLDTPCGLQLGPAVTVAVTYGGVFAAVRLVRGTRH